MAKDLEMGYLLDFYGEVLTQKQREMLRQYYNDDLSLSEIGENFGITRQGARDAIKHGETTLLTQSPRLRQDAFWQKQRILGRYFRKNSKIPLTRGRGSGILHP